MNASGTSWVPIPDGSDFGIANLPFGVARGDAGDHVVVAVGDHAVDLEVLRRSGVIDVSVTTGSLDHLLAAGSLDPLRGSLTRLLTDADARGVVTPALRDRHDLDLVMPFTVADMVDFYASETHATTAGRLFRPAGPALPPAWRHLPIGYHGRAGTVVVSGTPVVRPRGQRAVGDDITFGPSAALDFEVEIAAVIGRPSTPGRPVPPGRALDHVAGFVLLNDWSARDIQAFESQPLGPLLGKSFASSVSPWLVTTGALTPHRVPPPDQRPPAPSHLRPPGPAFDVRVVAEVSGHVVSRASFASMYWTVAQQIAHLTSNGTPLRTGDLLGSGTISDPGPDGAGCLLEATRGGTEPLLLPDGRRLGYLEDGDTVTLRAAAGVGPARVGFGTCHGTVYAPPDPNGGRT